MRLVNADCMEHLPEFEDNEFDLLIADVPYGINAEHGTNRASRKQFKDKEYGWDDCAPSNEYFKEAIRVSKNQIFWGANHFISKIPYDSSGWIVWDKLNPDRCFADCELAWTSFDKVSRIFNIRRVQELNREDHGKIHPTQKPVKLYEWLLMNYAKEGDKILDTHLGSMTIAKACHRMGYDLTGFEINKEYFDAGIKRLLTEKSILSLY